MQNIQKNTRCCSQPNHKDSQIEYFCLNENCHHCRFFCYQCLKEDKHTSHMNETDKISAFSNYSKTITELYIEVSTHLSNKMKEVQYNFQKYCSSLQQKYTISQEQFTSLNAAQLSQALQNMIKFKTNIQTWKHCFESNLNSVAQLISNQLQELELHKLNYIPQVVEEYPKILLLGSAGVGKTKLIKQITNDQKLQVNLQTQKITPYVIDSFTIVDSPSFETGMESNLQLFAQYLKDTKVSSLVIVVNFERIDLMKRKVSEVYKFIKNYQSMISIFIVDWQLSENDLEDKSWFIGEFQIFKVNNLQFIRNDASSNQLKQIFYQTLKPEQKIILTDSFYMRQQK